MFKYLKTFQFFHLYFYIPLLLINLYFLSLPLLNTLSYEFSVLNGILLFLLNFSFTLVLLNNNKSFNNKLVSIIVFYFISILIPLILILIFSIFNFFCSFSEGLLFYFFITIISAFIGLAIGTFVFALNKKFRWLLFIISIFLFVFIPLIEFYFYPQVYLYTPLIGYFPGVIYDEGISPDFKLILYRILNFIFFISLFLISISFILKTIKKSSFYFGTIFIFSSAILFFIISPTLGYSTNYERIAKELDGRIDSENFIIYLPSSVDSLKMKQILLLHEEAYNSLSHFLKVKPKQKIQSFIFENSEQKKRLFGAANADVAKPWLYHCYTSLDSYENSIKHELAHCFSAEFGTSPFKVASFFNPALIEGIATASYPFYDNNYIHFLSSAAFDNNYKINIPNLFSSLSFLIQTSSLAYIVSGSFSLFLIEKYGVDKYKNLYSTLNFNKIYGKDVKLLNEEYLNFLKEFSIDNSENIANYYFGRPSLITKICPRYASERINFGRELLIKKEFNKAENVFIEILKKTGSYSALNGLIYIYEETKDYNSALDLINKYEKSYSKSVYYYFIELKKGDLFQIIGEDEKANNIYQKIFLNSPNIRFETLTETRIKLQKEGLLTNYLTSEFDLKYEIIKKLNNQYYFYSSFPLSIELSEINKIPVKEFKNFFKYHFEVNGYKQAYSIMLLSKYFFRNNDLTLSRRTAGLSLRYKDNINFSFVTQDNFSVINWIYHNFEYVISKSSLNKNQPEINKYENK